MRTISAKVSDELYQILSDISSSKNITKSEAIKQAILIAKIEDNSLKFKRLYELNAIGNNLNQIAKQCNINKSVDKSILELLVSLEKKVNDL